MNGKSIAQAYLEDRTDTDVLPELQAKLREALATLSGPAARAGELRILTALHQAQATALADHGAMIEPARLTARLEEEIRSATDAVRTALEATLHLREAEARLAPPPAAPAEPAG